MKEHFYDMALSYYNKAKSVATSGTELALAQQKIDECLRLLNPDSADSGSAPSNQKTKSTSKILFTDQYLETGDRYSFEKQETISTDEDAEISLYKIEVHADCLVILSHEDTETEQELENVPAGLVIPLVSETKDVRRYASGKDGEQFIVYKKARNNQYGRYHVILRKEDSRYLKLYATAEFRQMMKDVQDKKSDQENQKRESKKQQTRTEQQSPRLPIEFTEHWFLNLDADQNRLGDSRKGGNEMRANNICWLTLRARYTCPKGYERSIRVDIKVTSPSGKVLIIPREGASKGYSTYAVLDTISEGGIFNFAFGADDPGFFIPGRYIVELWIGGNLYRSCAVDLKK